LRNVFAVSKNLREPNRNDAEYAENDDGCNYSFPTVGFISVGPADQANISDRSGAHDGTSEQRPDED
jgi:hypothetical protein